LELISSALRPPTYNATPDLGYTRDRLGRVTEVTRGGVLHAGYVYDPATLALVTEKLNQDSFERHLHRHYDPQGRPLSLALATTAGTVQYTSAYGYDGAGRLDRVWHHPALDAAGNPAGAATFTYAYTYTQGAFGAPRVGTAAAPGPGVNQDFMPYVVTRAAAGGNPTLDPHRHPHLRRHPRHPPGGGKQG
jgi:hypothetical protein